jgi:F-type H+-transporting ATPase subunit epsilon
MNEKTLQVKIVTPYEMFFDGLAEMVVFTCKDGEIGILPGHSPLIAALTPGEIRLKMNGQWRIAAATNGYAEVGSSLTIIVVNAAEWPEQIDVARAQKALSRADARLHDPLVSIAEKNHSRHGIARAKARLKVAGKTSPTP